MTDTHPSAAGPLGHIAGQFVEALRQGQRPSAEAEPTARPVLWARCWKRIRTWRLPPLWAARDWYERSAASGFCMASDRMARAYRNGELGLEADPAKAESFTCKK